MVHFFRQNLHVFFLQILHSSKQLFLHETFPQSHLIMQSSQATLTQTSHFFKHEVHVSLSQVEHFWKQSGEVTEPHFRQFLKQPLHPFFTHKWHFVKHSPSLHPFLGHEEHFSTQSLQDFWQKSHPRHFLQTFFWQLGHLVKSIE